jgi:hypothetical protein
LTSISNLLSLPPELAAAAAAAVVVGFLDFPLALPFSFVFELELDCCECPARFDDDDEGRDWVRIDDMYAGGRPHDLSVGDSDAFCMWDVYLRRKAR